MTTSHLVYLSNSTRVCKYPERLGTDFIRKSAIGGKGSETCKECMALIFAHNEKEFQKKAEKPLISELNKRHRGESVPDPFARGMFWGMVFVTPFWFVCFFILWLAFCYA